MSSVSDPTVSTPLSEEDAQTLAVFGLYLSQDVIGVIWETIFLSAYGIFFAIAVFTIFRKGLKSRSSIVMLCVVVYLYASSLTLWALNVTDLFINTHSLLMNYPNMPIQDRIAQAHIDTGPLGTPMEALFMFNMVIGDSVVIWRAWVLYQRTLWVVSIPCIMLLMSFVFSVIDTVCLTEAGWSDKSAIAGGGGVCDHAELMSWAFSLITNVTCTTLIGFKAWQHRKATRALNIAVNPRRMSGDRILSILVESGFIYCLFWLTQLILFFDISRESPLIYVYLLFAGMGDQISGLYPTLIIVIVNLHHTIWEEPSTFSLTSNTGGGAVNTSSVQWASKSKRSGPTTDTFFTQRSVNVHLDNDSEGINMMDIPSKELPSEVV